MRVPKAAITPLANELAKHWRLNPPGGECSCGHEVPPGASFTAHQVVAMMESAGGRALMDSVKHLVVVEFIHKVHTQIGAIVPHKGGAGAVYERTPNGISMRDWSYLNAVAYTGATSEIIELLNKEADREF